jgi:hypothetical protein
MRKGKQVKTYRGAPGWQGNNTGRGAETNRSEGSTINPEGSYMSGGESASKPNVKPKIRTGKVSYKTDNPHGQS